VRGSRGRPHCVVVGAGIGGLAAALSLHEIGADVEILEAVREVRALGVGINLLPHAVRELDALGLRVELEARSVAPSLLLYCTRRGQEIWREPRGLAAGYPWPQLSIHRGVLQEVLLEAVTARIGTQALHLGHRLERVETGRDGCTAVLAGGSRVEADVVVAADGIHSAARAQWYPWEGALLWNGSLLWRGTAEADPVLDGRTMVWAGHPEQKFVGYPIADLDGGRQLFNFIAELRRPDSGLAAREDWNRLGSLEDFLPAFESWDFGWLDVPAIVRAAPATYLFPMVDRDPVPRWTFGRATLLGDAAHPMYPVGSNGASQAILDARCLADALARSEHPRQALLAYERQRLPMTADIVASNRRGGPEGVIDAVEQLAPQGFADIDTILSYEAREAIVRGYAAKAGFAARVVARQS